MDYLIYDCEIKSLIPPKDGVLLPGYSYCKGWGDYVGMGISVVGFAKSNGISYAWWESSLFDMSDLVKITDGYKLIGFNSKSFDDKLLAANGVHVQTSYDLFEEILIAAGQKGKAYWKEGFSYSLGKIGEANGYPKTGSGELAPKLWQDGKYQEVIDYCLNDVKVTHELLKLGWAGKLIDPNTGKPLKLRPLA